jgi:hypothetical protein
MYGRTEVKQYELESHKKVNFFFYYIEFGQKNKYNQGDVVVVIAW